MKPTYIIILVVALVLGGYILYSPDNKAIPVFEDLNNIGGSGDQDSVNEDTLDLEILIDKVWRTTELTDIQTGETFTINQFDKPMLIESFAVWCPTCTKQQTKIKELHEEVGDEFISISLDTDPNENRQLVLDHITENGFDWYYAIASKEVTESLIDEFGVTVANAPSAPVVLIGEDKKARFLRTGVKSANELKRELGL